MSLLCLVPGMVSLWSLAVVAFERWLVICKPLGTFVFRPQHAIACCAMTWVFALIAAVPPLVGWSRSVFKDQTHNSCIRLDFFCNRLLHGRVSCISYIDCLSRYIPEGMQCSCGPDWYTTDNKFNNESYVMFLFCFCFSVPFFTIVFCYSQLLFTLKSVGSVSRGGYLLGFQIIA